MNRRHRTCVTVLGLIALLAGCTTLNPEKRELQKRRANSHYDLGIDHRQNGRLPMALREFMNAEEIAPRDARIQYALGETFMAAGKFEEAEKHLRRALRIRPDDGHTRLHLSGLLILQERFDEAIAECETLLDDPTFPTPWRALSNIGWAHLKVGRNAEARRNFEQAIAYNGDFWRARLNLGILEEQEGHRLEALQHYRDLLEHQLGARAEAEANYRIAEIYVSLGKRQRAIGHLKAALARAPEGNWGKKSEEYLKLLR